MWNQLWSQLPKRTERLWVFCDGGLGTAELHHDGSAVGAEQRTSSRNPGHTEAAGAQPKAAVPPVKLGVGCGALVRAEQGDVLDWAWRSLPPMTNNEAEYAGLLLGLELAARQQPSHVVFVMDSDIVVGQLCGRYRVQSAQLRRWHRKAEQALARLESVHFCAVPRPGRCPGAPGRHCLAPTARRPLPTPGRLE